MIRSFKHKGLRRLFEDDDRSRLRQDFVERIRRILAALDEAKLVRDVDQLGFRLHPLVGDLAGHWAVTVRANWRITFRFERGNVFDVDLVDYH